MTRPTFGLAESLFCFKLTNRQRTLDQYNLTERHGPPPATPVPAAPAVSLDRQSFTLVNGLRPEAADQTGSDFQREMREKWDKWLQETVDRSWEEAEDRYLYPNPRRAASQKRADMWNYLDYDNFEDHPAAQQRTRYAQSPQNEADYSSIPDRQSFTSVNLSHKQRFSRADRHADLADSSV